MINRFTLFVVCFLFGTILTKSLVYKEVDYWSIFYLISISVLWYINTKKGFL